MLAGFNYYFNFILCWLVLGCWVGFNWSYKASTSKLLIACTCLILGYIKSYSSASKSYESGIYSIQLKSFSQWTGRLEKFGLSFIFQSITKYIAELCTALINALNSLEQLVPLSYQISNASAFTPGAIAGYAWLFSPVLPSKLSQIIGGTAILVAIFELWIKFIL